MTLISIDLTQARQTAGTFTSSGNALDDVCGHLQQQWLALSSTWEGHSKHETEAEVRAVLNQGRRCAEFTRERGAKVTQIADRFQAADENEPFPVTAVAWQVLTPLAGLAANAPAVLGAQTQADLASLPVSGKSLTLADYDQLIAGYDTQLSEKQDRLQRVVPTALKNYQDILASDEQFLAETKAQLEGGNLALNSLAGTVLVYQKILAETQARMERTRQKIAELKDEQNRLPGEIDEIKEQRQLAAEEAQRMERQQWLDAAMPGARDTLNHDPNMTNMWKQVDAPLKNTADQRSVEDYRAVIDQFDVENSHGGRYRPDAQYPVPRCNVFTGDVLRAMDAPLPTKGEFYNRDDPMTVNAADAHTALDEERGGWHHVDLNNPADLQTLHDYLKAGKPAVASDAGHIAVIRPDNLPEHLEVNNLKDLHIAQAGGYNYNDIALGDAGYGQAFKPDFYIHE